MGMGLIHIKDLDNGLAIVVEPLLFARGRIELSDGDGYNRGWDYPDLKEAIAAAEAWDGEGDPADGWVRMIQEGRIPRRRPDGKPESEFRGR